LNRALAVSFAQSLVLQRPDLEKLGIDPELCIWCGAPRTCNDHLWPLTFERRWSGAPEIIVPACDPCNETRLSSSNPIESVEANPRVLDKPAAIDRIQSVIASAGAWQRGFPAEAVAERDALYARYDAIWAQISDLDQSVRSWADRWRTP
jgi:hypothetical protein